MKEIFDWLRAKMQNHIAYNESCHEEFKNASMSFTYEIQQNAWKNALAMVDEAEAKWEAECCEWKWGIDYAQVQCRGDKILFGSRRLFTYCPYCGKTIAEVE